MEEILNHGKKYFLPNLSVNLVIIGYENHELKCQLLKLADRWALPGGYVGIDESVDEAVERILKSHNSMENPQIEFLAVFGDKDRNFRGTFRQYFLQQGMPWKEEYWINERFVTLAYYSLVDIAHTQLEPGELHEAADWFHFEDLPDMWLDHRAIVDAARHQLRNDCKRPPFIHSLLPAEFTMPELHRLHQTILKENVDRSRFQKKVLASGMFERLPKLVTESRGSNPYKYRLRVEE
ncbi:MAG: NUDIX domain-containing protein [Bacteroidota bacterium]